MATGKTFKELDRKKKAEHIWEYYRWHIIGTMIGIVVLTSLITTVLRPRPPVYDTNLIVSGLMTYDEATFEQARLKFNETINADIELMPGSWGVQDQVTMMNNQMLMLKFQVRECDVLAISPERYDSFLAIEDFDTFAMLDQIPALEQVVEKHKDNLITAISKEDGKEHIFGIKTNKLNGLDGVQLGEEYIVSVITNPKDMDAAINLIKYMLE